MTKRIARSLSLLSCVLVGLCALSSSESEACGPYGGHWLTGEVTTEVTKVAEAKVVAKCGEHSFEASVSDDGYFWMMGIPSSAKACNVRAVVLDEDGGVHTTKQRVELPKSELNLHVARAL